jgi:hypothetical protein
MTIEENNLGYEIGQLNAGYKMKDWPQVLAAANHVRILTLLILDNEHNN